MPSNEQMRAKIIERIVKLRKMKAEFYSKSEDARKIMSDWAMGGPRPSMAIINEATHIIQVADNGMTFCFDQEQHLRKLAKEEGIEL